MKSGAGFQDGGIGFAGRVKADQSGYFIRIIPHLHDGKEVERYEFDEEGQVVKHDVYDERHATSAGSLKHALEIFSEKFGIEVIHDGLTQFWADSKKAYEDFVAQGVITPPA